MTAIDFTSIYYFMTVVGACVLAILCLDSFNRRVLRPKEDLHLIQYYLAGLMFVTLNVFFYVVLCFVFKDKGVDSTEVQWGDLKFAFSTNLMMPILLALLYAGTGTYTLPIGKRKINFFQTLLDVFQRLFSMKFSLKARIKEIIDKADVEPDEMFATLKRKQESYSERMTPSLIEKWDDVENDCSLLKAQRDYLGKLLNKLKDNSPADVITDIEARRDYLARKALQKMRRYTFEFVVEVSRTIDETIMLLKDIASVTEDINLDYRPNPFTRSLIVGAFLGLIMGQLLGSGHTQGKAVHPSAAELTSMQSMSMHNSSAMDGDIPDGQRGFTQAGFSARTNGDKEKAKDFAWHGMAALVVFSLFISVLPYFKTLTAFLVIGAGAGGLGHLTLIMLSFDQSTQLLKTKMGIIIGGALTMVLYGFRKWGVDWIKSPALTFIACASLGGVVMGLLVPILVVWGDPQAELSMASFGDKFFLLFGIGCIAMAAIVWSTNLFDTAPEVSE